jgi:hypothetical protein
MLAAKTSLQKQSPSIPFFTKGGRLKGFACKTYLIPLAPFFQKGGTDMLD